MNLKTLAVAALLATTAASSFATTTLTFDEGSTGFLATEKAGSSFLETYQFTLAGGDELSEGITSTYSLKTSSGLINNFKVVLTNTTTGTVIDNQTIAAFSGAQGFQADYENLTAGLYSLTLSGTVVKGTATIGGSLNVTPVPEPANIALLMAGMGVLAFVAKRRKNG